MYINGNGIGKRDREFSNSTIDSETRKQSRQVTSLGFTGGKNNHLISEIVHFTFRVLSNDYQPFSAFVAQSYCFVITRCRSM